MPLRLVELITIGMGLTVLPLAAVSETVAPTPTPPSQPTPTAQPSPRAQPTPTAASSPADPCAAMLAVVSRPSVTTAACAVPIGHVLIETGYQNTTPDGGAPLVQYPQALIRAGTALRGVEIDLGPPMLERSSGISGTSDTTFGAKYELGHSATFVSSVNAYISVPTGLNGSAGGSQYTANVNLSDALTPGVGIAGTFSENLLTQGAQRYTSVIPSVVLSGALTSTSTVFGEIALFSHALGTGTATRSQYLIGLQQSVANRVQFDISAGRSATQSTGKYRYIGAGISYFY